MAGRRDGEIVINLRRNNLNTPWGFRLQGGKEHGTYLSVQRVFNGSPSDGHLQRGDILVAVNNEDVTQWHQNEAQNLIQSIGLTLGLVVMRGGAVPYAEPRQTGQIQPVPSFARKPFGQQQQQQQYVSHPPPQHQSQPLSPQMTSKATLQFQPSPYSPSQPSNEFENIRPAPTVTWTPQAPQSPAGSFSAPLQVRIGQPPAKPYSFSPQQPQGDSRPYQPPPGVGQANYQQDYGGSGGGGGGGYAPYGGREAYPQSTQQPSYGGGGDSNHVTHDRNQSHEGFGHDDRNEQAFYERRREGGGGEGGGGEGGEEEEGEDYQQMSVRDIKQMFNKPDQKGSKAVSRVKQPQRLWTRPAAEGSLSPGAYAAAGPMPGQPSSVSPRKPMTGSVHRGPPPSDDDYRKPLSPQPHQQSYGHQPRYDAAGPGYGGKQQQQQQQKSSLAINKQGGAYGGIIQPTLPAKTPPAKSGQKGAQKKEFDPNQSAVYKILLEEEERKKNNPNQRDEEEEEDEAPRRSAQGPGRQGGGQPPRQAQGPKPAAQGSRLTDLLERDAAQIAPYKEKPKSAYQDHVAPPPSYHHDQRPSYQEPPSRAPYHQEPQQLHRGPPSHGAPVARQSQPSHYGGGGGGGAGGGYDYHQQSSAFPQTQYVDGIPTSDF